MPHSFSLDRRSFLKRAMAALPAAAVPAVLTRDTLAAGAAAVRVRGRVRAEGRGVEGVAVTDGVNVTQTAGDGTFEIVSAERRPFVYLSLPSGYRIPTHPTGTARFYQPITPDAHGEAEAEFTLTPRRQSGENHTFFLLADPQTQDQSEVERFHAQTVPDVYDAAQNSDSPAFGIGCGDLMFNHLDLFPTYEEAVRQMGVPFFQVIGNHDMNYDVASDWESAQTFRNYFGPAHYSFDVGAVHYVVLDDVFWTGREYVGYLTADQLAWLEQDLALVDEGRTVVVAQHIPAKSTKALRRGHDKPSAGGSMANRAAFYEMLDPYEAHLLACHTHEMEHVFEGGAHEHIHGTVCGAWWSGPICNDGTPKGYGVYEARGEELRWRYKSTGHDADHQLRTYERGADPKAPSEIIANVWDWDPEWQVFWYEDGARRGQMERRTGLDPLSVVLHEGEDVPERRPWVEPVPTGHLFYAPASEDAESVHVEATDRFGRTYTAQLGGEHRADGNG